MNKIDLFIKSQVTTAKGKALKFFFDAYFKDNVVRAILVISSLTLFVVWVLAIFNFKISAYDVPIRYNSFFGVTEIGLWYDLYRFPVFLTLTFFLNTFLSKAIYKKEKLVAYLLTATNIFLGAITLALIINFGRLMGAQ